MANNAEAARARRELKRSGAKKIGPITVADPAMWTEILREAKVVPPFAGKELTEAQLRDATERLILELCRKQRRDQAEAMLESVSKVRTGLIEREPPPPDTEERALNWRPSGDHWSFRKQQTKDKGRKYTKEEIEEYLALCAELDLVEDDGKSSGVDDATVTEAGLVQDIGMRIIGGGG
jgi:hypothetical protein